MATVSATLPTSVLSYSDVINIKVDRRKLHDSPSVVVYVFDKSSMPLGYAQVDCSVFLIQETTVANFGFTTSNDIHFEFSISATGHFSPDIMLLEPLLLRIPK